MRDTLLTVSAHLPRSLRAAVAAKLADSEAARVGERLAAGDATLWGPPGTPEIANRLGWLQIAERMLNQLAAIQTLSAELSEHFDDVALLGMGGSSLAAEVLRRCCPARPDRPGLHVLDSTDAGAVGSLARAIEPQRTLFIVSSKSGTTTEPLAMYAYFYSLVADGANFIAITDPGSPLAELAHDQGFRHTFLADPDIGGRYSALSPFGMVPAALAGIDVQALLVGSRAAHATTALDDGREHPAAVWLGVALSALAHAGRDKLTLLVGGELSSFGLWLEQLLAESTGKRGRGIVPVAEEPPYEPQAYGEDRVFLYLPQLDAPDPPLQAHADALLAAGQPLITVPTRGAADLGRLFLLSELAVAVAGWGLEINPFDQPNVQQAKDATGRVLDDYQRSGALPSLADADIDGLRSLLAGSSPGEYVALMGYVEPSSAFDDAIAELRSVIGARTRSATTFGYGPRYLHSTGQLHKGGAKTGRFLQLLADGEADLEIPGRPYTFNTLKNAQAIGDLLTLRAAGLAAERVRLAGDAAGGVRELTRQIKEAL